jgi:hypothetical protein
MVSLDCSCTHREGVTLVTASVVVSEEPIHVTVRNRLDGPVLPPRREGRPEAGWTTDGFAGVLEPGRHALGYAVEASPAEPPASLETSAPPAGAEPRGATTTPTAVLQDLGDPSPPADAVPDIDVSFESDDDPGAERSADESPTRDRSPDRLAAVPEDVTAWLDDVERRVEHAERLADTESLSAATTAVRDAGGLSGVRAIADSGVADERALRAIADRAERLADRRTAATVPTETLARLV